MAAERRSLAITDAYRARLRAISDLVLRRVSTGFGQIDPTNLDQGHERFTGLAVPATSTAQRTATRLSAGYLAAFLTSELGRRVAPPAPDLRHVGVSNDGRPLSEAYLGSLIGMKAAIKAGAAAPDALAIGRDRAVRMAALAIWGAARSSLSDAIKADRRIVGWRRVTHPGACGACLALAGEMLEPGEPLRIHGFCECTAEPVVGDVPDTARRPDGHAIFDALTEPEQDHLLGPEKATLIRGGLPLTALIATSPMATEPDWITEAPLDQLPGGR